MGDNPISYFNKGINFQAFINTKGEKVKFFAKDFRNKARRNFAVGLRKNADKE